jgi:replicative DNA helicase
MLSDLRDSGTIEQDADVVMGVYRGEVYYRDRRELRHQADLMVLKQRGGPTGVIPLTWLKEIVRFEDRAVEREVAA